MYYSVKIFISQFYYHLAKKINEYGLFKINKTAIIQFLTLQRLFGDITYDHISKYLPAASKLKFQNNKVIITKYWEPNFKKNKNSLKKNALELSNLFKESIKIKKSNIDSNISLFLSGGLDSRIVLSAFDRNVDCITFSEKYNNESRVAFQVAKTVNSNIQHIETGKDPFSKHLKDISKLGGGMYVFDHSIFLTLKERLIKKKSVFFHGHGIDFMLQGKYLPKKSYKLFNYSLTMKLLRIIDNDFTNFFINNIPYRLKKINIFNFINLDKRKLIFNKLYRSIEAIYKESLSYTQNSYDSWNYMTTHNLSRHFSHANLMSMATLGEVRSIIYYNKIFDFYHSIPEKQKINGELIRQTQKILSRKLSKIKSANDNVPANLSPFSKDFYRVIHKLFFFLGFSKQRSLWPSYEDRTHPSRDMLFLDSEKMMLKAINLKNSKFLIDLDLIDINLLSKFINNWIKSPSKGDGALIYYLITLDDFFHDLTSHS
ncbi:asparagine synthase-related protein [Pelagibacteraceae bacterium]|nr:asparagine synthase-related protein [Pelagibacteraceae bacterium]